MLLHRIDRFIAHLSTKISSISKIDHTENNELVCALFLSILYIRQHRRWIIKKWDAASNLNQSLILYNKVAFFGQIDLPTL